MTTAASTLVTRPGARIAFVLEIEGHDVAYTDVPDLATWTGYTVRPGLQMRGSVSRDIDLLGFDLKSVGFQFEIVDPIPWDTSNSLAKVLAHLDASALTTELTTALDRDDTTVNVRRCSHFPASGTIYVGHERIDYTARTQLTTTHGTFTGCTRGQFPTSATSAAAPGHWAHTHRVGTEAGPEVASKIRVWRNRMVTIYAVAADPDTGTWNSRADSLNELVGMIEDYGFKDGTWQFSCVSIEKRLDAPLFATQYQGVISGLTLGSTAKIHATLQQVGAATQSLVRADIPAGAYTTSSLIAKINALAGTFFAGHYVAFSSDGEYTKFTLYSNTAGDYNCWFVGDNPAGKLALRMLGWTGQWGINLAGYVSSTGSTSVTSPERAMATMWSPSQGSVEVSQTSGEWANQDPADLDGGIGDGFLMVADFPYTWQVDVSGNTFSFLAAIDLHGRPANINNLGESSANADQVIRYVGDDPSIPVKQIWMVRSTVSRMLLRMLLSTGTVGYSDATYDTWPASMSAGFPANLVDVASIEAIAERAGAAAQCFQVLMQPESMITHVESIMRQFGFHLSWRATNGAYKLTATVPTTIATLAPTYTLDTSNTGSDHDTSTASGAELVRNRLTLKYNRDPSSGEFLGEDVYENLSAISEQDEPSALEYEALMLYDLDGTKTKAWRTNVAAPMCAYFARPIRKHTRSGSRGLWFLGVGDVVLLIDPDMPDAATGAYGTSSKAWVTAVTKNFETYELESIELLIPPGKAYRYAPSAMLDYSRGDKGYDSANKRLYLRDHEFTRATDAKDVTYFEVNDEVNIYDVDPTDPTTLYVAAATTWQRTVTAVGPNYIDLATTLSAPAFSTAKRYYVGLASYATAAAGNQNRDKAVSGSSVVTFVDQDDDGLIPDGASGEDAFLWGSHLPTLDLGAAPTGDEHCRITPSGTDALDVAYLRDSAYAVANLWRHVTNQHPISEPYAAARTTSSLSYVQLAGPFKVWCPPGARDLVFSIDMLCTIGFQADVRVTCSSRRPRGASTTVLNFDNDVNQVVGSTSATSMTKLAITIAARPNQEGYTYVTLEFRIANAAASAQVSCVSAAFAPRDVT